MLGDNSAFPEQQFQDEQLIGCTTGLTKREYMAVHILTGLLAGCNENYNYANDPNIAANEAVNYADALLQALRKPRKN